MQDFFIISYIYYTKYALVFLLCKVLLRICADFEDERQVFLHSVTTCSSIFVLGGNFQKSVASIILVQ
jgi:hypothetical protein